MTHIPHLSQSTLASVPPGIAVPGYDRSATAPGIVHIGPGAFQRAHLASYVEALLPLDPRWGVVGIALRHGAQAAALAGQDYLYTLAELDVPARFQILGAMKDYLVAPADRSRAFARLTDPTARLLTITVTEKGYCLNAQSELDVSHPDIAHDLAQPKSPASLIGWLAESLARRRDAGIAPFVVMSCDNLASNGLKLRRAVISYAQAVAKPDLARWIESEVRFPSTMVDSITPATDDILRAKVCAATGLADDAPVQRESFTQWVIEDGLGPGMPDLASVGAQFTTDIHAYEQAKLRLLNGAHSALAYLGLQFGYATVGQAMGDPRLAGFIERLMREDIAPTLRPARGLDLPSYIGVLLSRLRNPAVSHRLAQIAADGSLKLPYRLLEPIVDLLATGRPITRPCVPVAAWMRFVRETACRGDKLDDPLADTLSRVAANCTGMASTDVRRFLDLTEIFPGDFTRQDRIVAAISTAYHDLKAALI